MLAATGLHKLPTHKGSGTSLLPPKPSSQAQIPSLHGLTYIVLADALHMHLSVSQSLEPYQMRQGASVRASRSSLMANGSRKYRASLLLGDPCQEANVKAHPSQASTWYLCALPFRTPGALRPQNHPCLTDPTHRPLHLDQPWHIHRLALLDTQLVSQILLQIMVISW